MSLISDTLSCSALHVPSSLYNEGEMPFPQKVFRNITLRDGTWNTQIRPAVCSLVFTPCALHLQSTYRHALRDTQHGCITEGLSVSNCWSWGVIKRAGLSASWKNEAGESHGAYRPGRSPAAKEGPDNLRMPSASPPFTDTYNIGNLRWSSISGGGVKSMFRTNSLHKLKTDSKRWCRSLHMNPGLIRRYAHTIIRWTSSLSLPLHMVILRTCLSLPPELTRRIESFPRNPWQSVASHLHLFGDARIKVTFTEIHLGLGLVFAELR